jgi:hypothetical protein
MTTKLFRQLIVAWWLIMLISVIVDLATEQYLPPELVYYLESAKPSTLEWFATGFILIGVLVASIGLYRIKRWGRTLFLWVNVLSLILSPLFGVGISSGWALVGYGLSSILSGGILFTTYLPPIANHFDKNPVLAERDNIRA